MTGRIWIPPYKPLGVSTQAVPGGGYLNVDASTGNFGPSPLTQLGLQAAEGAAGIATVVEAALIRIVAEVNVELRHNGTAAGEL